VRIPQCKHAICRRLSAGSGRRGNNMRISPAPYDRYRLPWREWEACIEGCTLFERRVAPRSAGQLSATRALLTGVLGGWSGRHRWGSARGVSTRGVPWGLTACSPHGAPFSLFCFSRLVVAPSVRRLTARTSCVRGWAASTVEVTSPGSLLTLALYRPCCLHEGQLGPTLRSPQSTLR
jgi:hypothetical protein